MARSQSQRSTYPVDLRRLALLALAVLLAALRPIARAEAQDPPGVRIIVHAARPETNVDRRFLVNAFLKKVTRWPDGETIHPVDLSPRAPVRQRFSVDFLGRPVAAVRNYWQQLIFSGRALPPPELDGDEAVVRFVLRNPGAIGYVSDRAELRGAKPLEVR